MSSQKWKKSQIDFPASTYKKLDSLTGEHPIQESAPGTYVSYQARKRKKGRVAYLNFDLAYEMGIIPKSHPRKLNQNLNQKLLDCFSLIIINEFDILNNKKYREQDIKPNMYMATRYLQMQHNSRIGKTSGDGRAIWNGLVEHKGKRWDVTSCGTGATCLSPASANNKVFYESGDPSISYGCGYAETMEAIGNSVFSEILYRNGTPTERTLCIIEYPGDFCVVVRAGENLLRPSHFFNHLKQGQYLRLKNMFDLFLEREQFNGKFKPGKVPIRKRYDKALEYLATIYAKSCAYFERNYIFCWLDWDGDNMLADGGIIDYGSIRQLGLYHHEYCFDDDERWSTKLKEQKQKGRYITQTFVQLIDFLKTGVKKNREKFKKHKALKLFDEVFEQEKKRLLLEKIGFDEAQTDYLIKSARRSVNSFEKVYDRLERWTSGEGYIEVPDGINKNAIFNMREFLRLVPGYYLEHGNELPVETCLDLFCSTFANDEDRTITQSKKAYFAGLQKDYLSLVRKASAFQDKTIEQTLKGISKKSAVINRPDRVTGDAMYHVGKKLFELRKKMTSERWHSLVADFVNSQDLSKNQSNEILSKSEFATQQLRRLKVIVEEFKEGL